MKTLVLLSALTIAGSVWADPDDPAKSTETTESEAPEELGTVKWFRDYEKNLPKVKKSGKPMFLIFQEVPG